MADYAIHDTTLIAQANILRKKFGTNDRQDPADYASKMNLMGLLEEKTQASASVCAFSDGADDVPTKSIVVTIPPTLSGTSEVTETQTGRNLFDISTATGGQINGTNGVYYENANWQASDFFPVHGANLTLSLDTDSSNYYQVNIAFYDSAEHYIDGSNNTYANIYSKTFTIPSGAVYCRASWSISVGGSPAPRNNIRINLGSADSGYTPYITPTTYTASLGRTIYGGQVDIVNGEGTDGYAKIIFNAENKDGWQLSNTIFYYDVPANSYQKNIDATNYTCDILTPVKQATNISDMVSRADNSIALYGNTPNYWRVFIKKSDTTTLEAFKTWISSNNVTFVYELATPTDFTFDGQEIPTKLGYNAFWSEQGNTEVTYRSSGTITPVPVVPTLITKTITENDTYLAEDDGADGYSEVIVNVSGGGTIIVDDLIEYPYPNNDNKCIYSSELSSQYAYYAFNPDCGNPYYWTGIGATNQYVGWKFDTAQIVNYYEIWSRNVGNVYDYLQAPKQWKLQGSNDDGSTWTDLDTQDFTFTAGGQKWAGAVNNTTAYKWYRVFVITAQDTANDTVIGYIDFKHAYIE